jgi:L-ribulokinase
MPKYSIGIDFGTLSGRAVLVDVSDGREAATSVYDYPHAVMDRELPDGAKLGKDWALQHPQDYIDVVTHTITEVMAASRVSPDDVIGIGIDFTACTALPVKRDGTPLCFLKEFSGAPHAYVKLWKHHAAQEHANRINELAHRRNEPWIKLYGGKISSEWEFPKLLQIYEEAPEIYREADMFVEAADWIIWQMTGRYTRNMCTAGYKAIWNEENGYPSAEYFEALSPGFGKVLDKYPEAPAGLGGLAGGLAGSFAKACGLREGTAVAVANVDAHVTIPALGIDATGKMLAIMGTSTCHILLGDKMREVPGMCGVVKDGVLPGFYGYEAGQSCVGDHFAWAINTCVPPEYYAEAERQGKNIHVYLRGLAEKQRPGESGLLALDWWNGNRSVLVDADLSGMMIGMNLQTRPEEIYRALIEATAYGTRMIIETFEENGVPVNEFYASGGISQKDPMTMQIYADVINRPVKIAGSIHGPALGSAIFGAVAAGSKNGGYDDVFTAARVMGTIKDEIYTPKAENVELYNLLYREYAVLHDYFGRGENDVMKRLREIRNH